MLKCPECGGRVVENEGFLVCGSCGLVYDRVVESISSQSTEVGSQGYAWALFESAQHFRLSLDDCYRFYRVARFAGASRESALAIALYVALRERGDHVPLRRVCSALAALGVKVNHKRAIKDLFKASRYLPRPTPLSAVKVYARRLRLSAEIVQRAEKILLGTKYLGGRDPFLLAIAALYIAASGELSYYRLAKETGRAPSRIRDNVLYILTSFDQTRSPSESNEKRETLDTQTKQSIKILNESFRN